MNDSVMQKKGSTVNGTVSISRGTQVLLSSALRLFVGASFSGPAEPTVLKSFSFY